MSQASPFTWLLKPKAKVRTGQLKQTPWPYQATRSMPKLFAPRSSREFRDFPTVLIAAFPLLLAGEGMGRKRSITLETAFLHLSVWTAGKVWATISDTNSAILYGHIEISLTLVNEAYSQVRVRGTAAQLSCKSHALLSDDPKFNPCFLKRKPAALLKWIQKK